MKFIPVPTIGEWEICVASRGWNDRVLAPDYGRSTRPTGATYSRRES